nr:transposase [Actinomadura geliboluensis]
MEVRLAAVEFAFGVARRLRSSHGDVPVLDRESRTTSSSLVSRPSARRWTTAASRSVCAQCSASASAPRFRDLQDQRFWRADLPDGKAPAAGYGPLEVVARNKADLKRIATHWPDGLRVAESLITNQVRPYDLPCRFSREGHPTPIGAAAARRSRPVRRSPPEA